MRRRADRGLVSVLAPLLAFVVFGVARVDAPVSLIGLIFDSPMVFALTSTALALGGAVLLFVRPVELRLAQVLAPSREPTAGERARLQHLLGRIGQRARMDTERLILRVEASGELNGSAGAAHLLFVTQAALRRSDGELEALLAHELGHHHGLHPVATAIIWWLSLPGEALAALYRAVRRLTLRVTRRLRPLAILGQVFLLAWQVSVMWLYYVGKLLAQRAARMSEYTADRAAAEWGYADQLASLFSSLEEAPPQGRFARLLADHPPLQTRIEQLAAR